MPDILEAILAQKRSRLEQRRNVFRSADLEKMLASAPPPRDAIAAILSRQPDEIAVIAEIKRKSPSKGAIRPDLSVAEMAGIYERGGACAVSVLCEQDFFGGSLNDLSAARSSCSLPVLCKDFIISNFQTLEARIHGADMVLLIVAALTPEKLFALYHLIRDLGMTPLIEVHNAGELETALQLGVGIIGINNRNLKTLEISLETTAGLLPQIPGHRVVISESGFYTREELERFSMLGASGFLVGSSILEETNPEAMLKELVHGKS